MKAKTKVLGIRLTDKEYEDFKAVAGSEYDTMSRMVRVFILNKIKKHKEGQ